MSRDAKLVMVCGVLCLVLAMGIRQSFGIFQAPIAMDLDVGRQVFGFGASARDANRDETK
jgi:hypothetical protein